MTKTKQKTVDKKPPKVVSVDEKIEKLSKTVNTLVDGMSVLMEAQANKEVPASAPMAMTPAMTPTQEDETKDDTYVPKNFRKLCNVILSPAFGMRVVDFDDRMDFMVEIIVPDEFSSLTPQEKEKGVRDIRSKMIARAVGENGVKEWCQLIRQNLNKYFTKEGKASPFK